MKSKVAFIKFLLFKQVDPFPIFFLRLVIGLIFFFYYLTHFNTFIPLFSTEGISGAYSIVPKFLNNFTLWTLYFLILTSSLSLIVGFYTRVSLVIVTTIHLFFWIACPPAYWGWGSAILFYCYILLFCNPGRVISIDSKGKSLTVPNWNIKAIQIFTSAIYITVMLNRVGSISWANGTAVQIGLTNAILSRSPNFDWSLVTPILTSLTYYTLLIEGLGAILIFLRRYQKYVLLGLIALHIGTEIFMTVGYWQYLMLAALASFFPQDWCKYFYKKIKCPLPTISKRTNFRFEYSAILLISLIGVLSFIGGLPNDLVPNSLFPAQKNLRNKLYQAKLNNFSFFNLFSRPTGVLAYCFIALGETNSSTKIIYKPDIQDCLKRKFNIFVEPLNTSFFIMYTIQLPHRGQKTLEGANIHLGEYFCKDPLSKKPEEIRNVHFGYLSEQFKWETIQKQGDRKLSVIFSYDCKLSKLYEEKASAVFETLKRDHPLFSNEFTKLNFSAEQ